MSVDAVRTPEERLQGLPDYPFESRYREVDGLRLAHLDEGEGPPVVFFHGEPTWSFLWRRVIPPVRDAGYRCIAPDYAGFGRSDKPTDIGWYSYDRHVDLMAMLLEELDLRDATVVVHDWGGPIGLRFAVEHADLVDRLVITDTGIGGGRPPGERWLRFREVVRSIGGELDIGRLVDAGTAQGLPDEVRAAYDAPFPSAESKAGALAFPELVPTEPEHPNTAPLNAVRDALRDWRKPTLVVWGAEDTVLTPRIAEGIVGLIPGAEGPVLLEGASHFLQEDRPDELAAAVRDFIRS
jgi:haloalkane dehalogenase